MESRKLSPWTLLRRVSVYLRAHRARFAGGIGLVLLGIAFEVIKPWPIAIVFDSVLAQKPVRPVLQPLLGNLGPAALLTAAAVSIAVIQVIIGLLTLGSNYLTIDVGQRMVNDLRTAIYSHLQRLSLRFHHKQETGDLLFRVMADTFSIQSMVMSVVMPLVSSLITLVAMFWVMMTMDRSLAFVALGVCPFLYVAIARLNRRIHGHATASREAESALYSSTERTIDAVKLVQAYGREERVIADFRRDSERSLWLTLRLYNTQTLYGWVVDSILAIGTALIVWLGARHVLNRQFMPVNQQITAGELWVFFLYLQSMYKPIQEISQNLAELSTSRAGLERVFEVLDKESDIQDRPGAPPMPEVRGAIHFEHVTFAYEEGRPVLRDVNLQVAAGEKVALVGRTGAGKSTLASLVLRFFDPQAGRVTIDGHDLRDVSLASLRGNITLLLQEPILFHSTVSANIAFGAADATPEKIQTAARQAEADEFIVKLPGGYDSLLGEGGMTLSGGQRQRLALARALLRNTPIVVLDEPTSSLDLRTETFVWRNVERLLQGKTAIVIAHRLSTARMADRIVVLEDGSIVEQGTHDELLNQHGVYHQLWQRHNAGADFIEAEPVLS
jgi:ATP-binding cassette subfamily B protein/subfamily B ATP-binding cassette protein MsbA